MELMELTIARLYSLPRQNVVPLQEKKAIESNAERARRRELSSIVTRDPKHCKISESIDFFDLTKGKNCITI